MEFIGTIIIGLVLMFAGYRLKRLAMSLIWFVIGYNLVGHFAPNIIEDPFWQMILQGAVGVLLSMIGLSIEKFAVAATTGVAVFWLAMQRTPIMNVGMIYAAIFVALVAAGFSVRLMKPALIVITAITGANIIASDLVNIIPAEVIIRTGFEAGVISAVLFVALAFIGTLFQFKNTKNMQ